MTKFYHGLKEAWGPKNKGPVHLKLSDIKAPFSDSKRFVAVWREYIQKLANVPDDIEHEVLEQSRCIIKRSPDEIPTMDEMAIAISGLKDGKEPGETEFLLNNGSMKETTCSEDCTS